MSRATRSCFAGLWAVLCAPGLMLGVLVLTLGSALPFALVLGQRLQQSLATQPPLAAHQGEIDPEWWMEFREHARGLAATFTPAVIGFAGPLGNLSAMLDGEARPWALAGPVAVTGLVWAFLWGGIYDRFQRGQRPGLRRFMSAAWRHLPRLIVISIAAAAVVLVLYLTVHALLFGPVYEGMAARLGSERDAFFARLALYAVFGALLMAVGLVADYARITAVRMPRMTVIGALADAARFVRQNAAAVVVLYLMIGTLFVVLLTTYGWLEAIAGTRLGGWRAIALGQAYIVGRLFIRLTFAASQMRLYESVDANQNGAGA